MSKRLLLFLLLLISCLGIHAQKLNDSTYYVAKGTVLKKMFHKKEFPFVKALAFQSGDISREDAEFLTKLPNLKIIYFAKPQTPQVSTSSPEYLHNDPYTIGDDFVNLISHTVRCLPSVEIVRDYVPWYISYSGENIVDIVRNISKLPDPRVKYRGVFPFLKEASYEFIDTIQWKNMFSSDKSSPISYYENTYGKGFVLYPKYKVAVYNSKVTKNNCDVYKMGQDSISSEDLKHPVVIFDYSKLENKNVFIPRGLYMMFGNIYLSKETKFNFEEGDAPLLIDVGLNFNDMYTAENYCIDSLVVNRPLIWEGTLNESGAMKKRISYNYLIFNKVVTALPKGIYTYMASFAKPLPDYADSFDITANYIMVPKGCKESYVSHGLKNVYEQLDSKLAYNIKESKPGTLLSYISPDSLFYVDSLTISGFLYDTECKLLKKCRNLSYLNLRNAIIIESPESERRDKENMEAFSAYLGMLSKSAGLSVVSGDASAADYLFTQGVVDLLKGATLPEKVANKVHSFLPSGVFSGTPLQTAILPRYCSSIGNSCFYGCDKLENVVMPENLKEIGNSAFYGCSNLKAITFPKCLESIDQSAFRGCNSLSVVDLSECHFCEVCLKMNAFWESGIKVLKLPYGVTRLNENFYALPKGMKIYFNKDYVGSSYLPAELKNLEVFFQTTTPPDVYCVNCKVHVPKGSLTSYYSKLNRDDTWSCDNTFVEE